MTQNIIEIGAKVIETEAAALSLMAQVLDENFTTAVALTANNQGRVIVSGVGKSGHNGRKLSFILIWMCTRDGH